MSESNQEAKSEVKVIDGKKTVFITPECEVTLTNTVTGKEYMSDSEADQKLKQEGIDPTIAMIIIL